MEINEEKTSHDNSEIDTCSNHKIISVSGVGGSDCGEVTKSSIDDMVKEKKWQRRREKKNIKMKEKIIR